MLDEDDLQEEIRSHLKMAADDRLADGSDPRGAQLDALKDFGNVAHTREAARHVWTPWWLELLHDRANGVTDVIRLIVQELQPPRRMTSVTPFARSRKTRCSRSPSSAF